MSNVKIPEKSILIKPVENSLDDALANGVNVTAHVTFLGVGRNIIKAYVVAII
jgi:hypothetical protein